MARLPCHLMSLPGAGDSDSLRGRRVSSQLSRCGGGTLDQA